MAYTVKKGDTLQGLYGPNWKTISGFTGDPTKLQIGTQLPDIPVKPGVSSVMPSIQPPIPSVQSQTPQISTQQPVQPQISPSLTPGATLPQTAATTQPTADDIATALIAKLGGVGTQETPESRRQSYLDFITGQQKTYGEQLGIPGQEARLSPIKQQIDQTNEMLDKLEADLNERVKGLGVGENLRRRYLAAEQGPLTQQLGELGRAYTPLSSELQTNKQRLAEMMGLSKEAFQYGQQETSQQQLARKIAEQQALQAIEPPKYTSVSPGETIYDPKTGKEIYRVPAKEPTINYPTSFDEWTLAGKPGTYADWLDRKQTETTTTKNKMTSYLAQQGIPLTVADSSGELTKTALNKVTSALGGNLELAQTIWGEMKLGKNFEQIRQMMREANLDLGLLDKFVQALQGKEASEGISNPFD